MTRQPTDLCLLCSERPSTQKKSHIIPKHFGQGIFHGTNPRHGIAITIDGKEKKVQDIIKQDFILCPYCEKGLSVIETYCILRLNKFNDLRYFDEFRRHKEGEFEFFEPKKIDNRVWNLFIYSIVWRLSMTDIFEFQKLKLPEEEENKLRLILKNFMTISQGELMEKINGLTTLPDHSHVILRPKKKLRPPGSMLSAASLDKDTHQIHLVDYLLIYLSDKNRLVDLLKRLDNNTLDRQPRIGLTTKEYWESFNFDLLNKWTKKMHWR